MSNLRLKIFSLRTGAARIHGHPEMQEKNHSEVSAGEGVLRCFTIDMKPSVQTELQAQEGVVACANVKQPPRRGIGVDRLLLDEEPLLLVSKRLPMS